MIRFILAFLMVVVPQIYVDEIRNGEALIINKRYNKMLFVDNGEIKQYFSVATGKTNELTPEGEFKIVAKIENPYYIKGDIPGGDPSNPLGTRWMGFNALGTDGTKYGIHGNNNPSSIGQHISNGCIRMYNNEIEELYPKIPIGSKVIIVDSPQSLEETAREYGLID